MSEELRLDVVTVAHSKGLTDAARDVEKLKGETDKLGDSFEGLSGETEHWSEETRKGTVDAKSLNAELEKSRKGVKALEAQLVEMGNDPGLRKELRSQRSWLAELERIDKEIAAVDKAAEHVRFEAPTRDVRSLNEELILTRLRVGDLQRGVGSDSSLLGDLKRAKADLKELERVAKEVKVPDFSLAGVMGGGKKRWSIGKPEFGGLEGLKGMLIPGLIGLGVAVSPAIGAMVSGAVVGAVGLGGIVGGVVAAAGDPKVKAAFSQFTQGITADDFGRQALVDPTIKGIAEISRAFDDLHIGDALGKGADAVPILAKGIGDFARNLMPGFNLVMDQSTGIANIFADGLGNVGDATSDMLIDLMKSPGTLEGLQLLFLATGDAIRFTGATLAWLGDGFDELNRVTAVLSGGMEDLYFWFPPVHDMLAGINDRAEALTGTGGTLVQTIHGIDQATALVNAGLDPFAAYLKDAGENAEFLNVKLSDLFGPQMDLDQATLKWKQDLLELKDSVKQHGTSLKDNTTDGLANQQMILGMIQDAQRMRDAMLANGQSTDTANKAYMDQVKVLQDLLVKMGFSKAAIDALVGEYKVDIFVTTTYAYKGTPPSYNPGSKSFAQSEVFGGFRAAGGSVEAGKGYIVGERGPEPFFPSTNGTIMPNSSLSSMGGGKLQFTMVGTGDRLLDAILEGLRLRIMANGGLEATFN